MKKLTKIAKVRSYVKAHPKATASDITKLLPDVSKPAIYQLLHAARKHLGLLETTSKRSRAKAADANVFQADLPTTVTVASTLATTAPVFNMEPTPHDPVNHPAHYTFGGIETIEFIEAKRLNYNLGNAVKYITRADHKGTRKQDIEKSIWYLRRELERQA